MLHKTFELLETKTDGEPGEFTALVSTFGNVDRVGDRILPGAYAKTLEQRRVSGDPLPIIFAHKWDDPMAHVGVAAPGEVVETEKGLLVKGRLDVEDNPLAAQVYKLMRRRSLKEFSIGYGVPKGGEKRAKDGANEISEIDLAECGPCLKGIDPKTELHDVKSALAEVTAKTPVVDEDERKSRDDLITELEQVRAELAKALADLETQKAEVTDKEPKARSVDPLSERAQKLALEVRSGGLSAKPPKRQVAEKPSQPEPEFDPAALREYTRGLFVQVLSGRTE